MDLQNLQSFFLIRSLDLDVNLLATRTKHDFVNHLFAVRDEDIIDGLDVIQLEALDSAEDLPSVERAEHIASISSMI